MRRSASLVGLVAACAATATIAAAERTASACGGCFHPPTQTASDITDERMLLSVSQTQTTLYDQIRYQGSPKSFAWVLPIKGTVDVGLSADVLFDSVDVLTSTQIQAPPLNCPGLPADCPPPPQADFAGASGGGGGAGGGVTVTKQEIVGPYETVQLKATDPTALNQWLAKNGFTIPADVTPVIDQYLKEGFDFLAMKLLPNQGVQAMRPVRVSTTGASLSLPLRMAAVGTGATVGITIWVVSDGRYEPQNFPFFHIDDSALVWDWSTSSSNYTTLRGTNAKALGGKGWEIESSLNLAESLVSSVILYGGQYYGGGGQYGGGGGQFGGGGFANASDYYLAEGSADGGADAGAFHSAEDVRQADIKALFAGMAGPNVRITRMRSDISHAAMTADFKLQASADQGELSNLRLVTKSINEQCPVYKDCAVTGYGPPDAGGTGTGGTGGGYTYSKAPPGGCVVSSSSDDGPGLGFGAALGVAGLAIARGFRRSKARKQSRRTP